MTDQVMDLVTASPNFRFLADASIPLGARGAMAESYVYSDPIAALLWARQFGETLVKLVMERSGLPVQERQAFARGIRALRNAQVISDGQRRALDELRESGNAAVHAGSGDPENAATAVRTCFELALWWHRAVTGRAVEIAYTTPVPGVSSAPQLLLQVERQLAGLQATLDASLARNGPAEVPAPAITIGPVVSDRHRWRAGSTVECDGVPYLVYEPIDQLAAEDGSWTLIAADGHCLDATAAPVRLRAMLAETSGAATTRMVEGLAAQSAYLRGRGRSRGLPELLTHSNDGKLHIAVTTRTDGATWHETFDGGGQPLDPLIVPLVVDALVPVADALTDLHRRGTTHRTLSGNSILVTRSGRGMLRDLGLAWWPPLCGEGGEYRAPEQRSVARGRPGPATDIFQLAALLHHTCSGIRPGTGSAARLGILLPGFPKQLDTLLADALAPDPAHRPDAAAFTAGLRRGRRALAVGATHGH